MVVSLSMAGNVLNIKCVWGHNVLFVFILSEICSAYPSAGSVYHWSAQVVPIQYAPLCSYICGWFNFLGNAAGDASFAYAWASVLNAAILVSGGISYSSNGTVAVSIAVLTLWTLLNCFRVDQLGWVNNIAAYCQILSLLFISISLFSFASNSSTFVFTHYVNETGFTNNSYVIAIGILTSLFSFTGFEASAHMAEGHFHILYYHPTLLQTIFPYVLSTSLNGFVNVLPLSFFLSHNVYSIYIRIYHFHCLIIRND